MLEDPRREEAPAAEATRSPLSTPQDSPPPRLRTAMLLALSVWAIVGMTITVDNLRAYTLQHAGVESLVERGTFAVGQSRTAELSSLGDTFEFGGRTFAAKQPGQFVLGAVPYAVLHALGLRYSERYDLCAALVTWLSASLAVALGMGRFFLLMARWGAQPVWLAASTTLLLAFGTNLFAYAGVAHHDAIATALLVFALADAVESDDGAGFWGGVFLGLVPFSSMLPAVVAGTLFAIEALRHLAVHRRPRRLVQWLAGVALGLAPLLIYDGWYFGHPFRQANVAGDFQDTFLRPTWQGFSAHLQTYFGSGDLAVWKFMPVVLLGWLGALALLRRKRTQHLAAIVLAASAAHLLYILDIETIGGCQYGPRYLMPLLPLALAGLSGVTARGWWAVAPVALYGVAVSAIGALGGTMYCGLPQFAAAAYWRDGRGLQWGLHPLLWPAIGVAVCACGLAWFTRRGRPVPPVSA